MLSSQAQERGIELSYVAGFKAWLRLGRCVRKGESAFKIFGPIRPRRRRDDDDTEATDKATEDERPQQPRRAATAC